MALVAVPVPVPVSVGLSLAGRMVTQDGARGMGMAFYRAFVHRWRRIYSRPRRNRGGRRLNSGLIGGGPRSRRVVIGRRSVALRFGLGMQSRRIIGSRRKMINHLRFRSRSPRQIRLKLRRRYGGQLGPSPRRKPPGRNESDKEEMTDMKAGSVHGWPQAAMGQPRQGKLPHNEPGRQEKFRFFITASKQLPRPGSD
jgi:hypothetical protein